MRARHTIQPSNRCAVMSNRKAQLRLAAQVHRFILLLQLHDDVCGLRRLRSKEYSGAGCVHRHCHGLWVAMGLCPGTGLRHRGRHECREPGFQAEDAPSEPNDAHPIHPTRAAAPCSELLPAQQDGRCSCKLLEILTSFTAALSFAGRRPLQTLPALFWCSDLTGIRRSTSHSSSSWKP